MSHIAVVTVPFIKAELHRRLAHECITSIRSSYHVDRIAIVNSIRSESDREWLNKNFDLVEFNDVNILARAWNRGIRRALERGAELIVVSNLDLIFHPLCFDNLLECSRQEPDAVVWSPVPWRDRNTFRYAQLLPETLPGITWSCFAINKRLIDLVGSFDEAFTPAYLEDSDMNYRIKLAGLRGVSCRAAVFYDYDRGTLKGLLNCAPEHVIESATILANLRASITKNDDRYIRKWGGLGGEESFTMPFNGHPSE